MGEGSESWGRVVGLGGIMAIDGMWETALALKSDGTIWAFGDGPTVQVSGITGAVGISGFYDNCVALTRDGTVWEWRGSTPDRPARRGHTSRGQRRL